MIYLVLVLFFIVGGILALAASRDADFAIERRETVAAPPAAIFPLIDTLARWQGWSPWQKMEPAQSLSYSGPPAGVGAALAWAGKKTGRGRMEIVESIPHDRIGLRLNFEAPMKAENHALFILTPEGAGTRVIWRMSGRHGFAGKLFTLFMNMDRMVGRDFERGLADLKRIAEAGHATEG